MTDFESTALLNKYLDRERLDRFMGEVMTANQKFNLVSRNAGIADLELLAAESLIPVEQGWIGQKSESILDLGSGWGIPILPILLAGIEINAVMDERSQKKADFLLLLLHRLGLKAEVVCSDLMAFKAPSQYSIITMRGVALDEKLLRKLRQFSRPGGEIIYFGDKFPVHATDQTQIIDYSIDNLPERHLTKYRFV